MKIIIAKIASFTCFWLGHGVSKIMHRANFLGRLYPIYNRLMTWSANAENWAGIDFMWSPRIYGDVE